MRVLRVLAPNPGIRELEGTNTWILGEDPSIVIDPGPEDEGHLRDVGPPAGAREAGHVAAILLTHGHPDHAPGAPALAGATGARIHAHAGDGVVPLRDRQTVDAGTVRVQAVATPGHTPDHVAFLVTGTGALFTGDAVLGRGTSVIDPPEGDLTAYLRSLRRLRDLAPSVIYPGHGPVVFDAIGKLDEYLEHRALRERQVVSALEEGRRTPEEIVPAIYVDEPAELYVLAARSVLAHLIKLEAEGRAEKRAKDGVVRWSLLEQRACARCGRPVKGRGTLCGSCSLEVLQESG